MAAIPLELLRTFKVADSLGERSPRSAPARPCDWPELDRVLPDGGLPHAVVEITCAHHAFAGATRVAVSAIAAAQRRSAGAWCAWMDASATLFAPGLARAGIDLARLLVVRPSPALLPRIVVMTAQSGAFDVVVVEVHEERRADKLVRKLALAAEQHGTTIVMLAPPHADPWPVALRLEISRTEDGIDVRVTKDRFGRAPVFEARLAKTHVPVSRAWNRSTDPPQAGRREWQSA